MAAKRHSSKARSSQRPDKQRASQQSTKNRKPKMSEEAKPLFREGDTYAPENEEIKTVAETVEQADELLIEEVVQQPAIETVEEAVAEPIVEAIQPITPEPAPTVEPKKPVEEKAKVTITQTPEDIFRKLLAERLELLQNPINNVNALRHNLGKMVVLAHDSNDMEVISLLTAYLQQYPQQNGGVGDYFTKVVGIYAQRRSIENTYVMLNRLATHLRQGLGKTMQLDDKMMSNIISTKVCAFIKQNI